MLPVAYRLSLAISFVLLLAVLITAALNFLKFRQVTETLEASRFDFIARDIVHAFEQNLTLGLPLEQIANGQAILARQADLDPAITRIEIFDADGTVLYSALRLDENWARSLLASAGPEGSTGGPAPAETFSGRAIVNDFGQAVGGVTVYRSTAAALAREQAIMETLMIAVAGATLAGVGIVVLGATRLSRDVRERLLSTATALRSALGGTPPRQGHGLALALAAAEAMAEIDLVDAEISARIDAETEDLSDREQRR
jgi:hypothetical protein